MRSVDNLTLQNIQSDLTVQRQLINAMLAVRGCEQVSLINNTAVTRHILEAQNQIQQAIARITSTNHGSSNHRERSCSVVNIHVHDDRAVERRTQLNLIVHNAAVSADYELGACYNDPVWARGRNPNNSAPPHTRMDGWMIKRVVPNTLYKAPRAGKTLYTFQHNDGPGYCHPEERPTYVTGRDATAP